MIILTHKLCTKCQEIKLTLEFYKDNTKPDKLTVHCKDCVSARSIIYYHAHEEERREYIRCKRADCPEENRQKSREYYWNHLEERKECSRKRIKDHPEINRQNRRNRRAQMKGAPGRVSAKEWQELCEKSDNTCLCCGKTDIKLTQDHIIPISLGGSNTIDNIQPLCAPCNSSKKKKIINYSGRRYEKE